MAMETKVFVGARPVGKRNLAAGKLFGTGESVLRPAAHGRLERPQILVV